MLIDELKKGDGGPIYDAVSADHSLIVVAPRPQQQPPQKRTKLELSKNVGEAFLQVKGWAEDYKIGSIMTKFCHPFEVKETWKESELATLLREATDGCFGNLVQEHTSTKESDRRPLVVSIRVGLGNGKTHALRQAPRLLGAATGVYITYNGQQSILKDAKQAGKCVLLRILFALLGTENYGAARFFDDDVMYQLWTSASSDYLLELTAHGAAEVLDDKSHLCICVDELRKLKSDIDNLQVQELLSTLGRLTEELYKLQPPIRCSILVTALTDYRFNN